MNTYQDFLARKAIIDAPTGITNPKGISKSLFEWQRVIVEWGLKRGRAAFFEGTGLGKTPQQCEWSKHVAKHTAMPVLLVAPLAVSHQTINEAKKILGLDIEFANNQSEVDEFGLYITNYQKLDKFDPRKFGGLSLDESSILKSIDGSTKQKLIDDWTIVPFRSAWTATPAPNDYMELGNHAEFLGVMKSSEMLSTFFVHDGGETQKWRLKGHAEKDFWKWMASWAVCITHPRDIGFEQEGYDLPPLRIHEVIVDCDDKPREGDLFAFPARTLQERRGARRISIAERIKIAYELANDAEANSLEEMVFQKQGESSEGEAGALLQESTQNRPCEAKDIHEGILPKVSRKIRSKHARKEDEEKQGKNQSIQNGLSVSSNRKGQGAGVCTEESREDTRSKTKEVRTYDPSIRSDFGVSERSMLDLRQQGKEGEVFPDDRSLSCNDGNTGDTLHEMQHGNREVSRQSTAAKKSSGVFGKWIYWCGLNQEQDELADLFAERCASIQGSTDDDEKVKREQEWRLGETRILISKVSVFGWGLNWQHCNKMAFVGLSDSFESIYQAIRRIWRFGQQYPCDVYIIISSQEGEVLKNIKRKEADAMAMIAALVDHMADLTKRQLGKGATRTKLEYKPTQPIKLPSFLKLP